MKRFLAIDIGASSGRHIVGYLEKDKLITDEVYRFSNSMKSENGHLIWDIDYIFSEVKNGIKAAFAKYQKINSLAIDTWGVDYVLMNGDKPIYPVYAYRDFRTKEVIDNVHNLVPFSELYAITGCQFQEFNTIYQLYDDKLKGRLDDATDFLHIPEYLAYLLTGKKVKEFTNASTTALTNAHSLNFDYDLIEKLGFPIRLFKQLSKPGIIIGRLLPEIEKEVLGNLDVVLSPTHDTASAVEGIPLNDADSMYISSGTWSLLGIKLSEAIITKEAMEANYSNEFGPNYIRFQKNIMGLWVIQCLANEMNYDFSEMVRLAESSNYANIYNINDNRFMSSSNMRQEIVNWFIDYNQVPPVSDSDIINATYHSLAYSYKVAIDELEFITKKSYDKLYIVGGGAKNDYLNELTAKYTNKQVIALPIEASAVGNLLSQIKR